MSDPLTYVVEKATIAGFSIEDQGIVRYAQVQFQRTDIYGFSIDRRWRDAFADETSEVFSYRPFGDLFLSLFVSLSAEGVWNLAYHAPEGLEPDEEPKYFLRFEKSGDSIVLVGMFSFFIVMKSLLQNAFFWPRLLSWQRQNWREGRALEF